MSDAAKIHPSITKSDALVIYDRDNVMVDPTLYIRMSDALIAQSNFPDTDIWSVVVERKHKVGEETTPRYKRKGKTRAEILAENPDAFKKKRRNPTIIVEYVKGDSIV